MKNLFIFISLVLVSLVFTATGCHSPVKNTTTYTLDLSRVSPVELNRYGLTNERDIYDSNYQASLHDHFLLNTSKTIYTPGEDILLTLENKNAGPVRLTHTRMGVHFTETEKDKTFFHYYWEWYELISKKPAMGARITVIQKTYTVDLIFVYDEKLYTDTVNLPAGEQQTFLVKMPDIRGDVQFRVHYTDPVHDTGTEPETYIYSNVVTVE